MGLFGKSRVEEHVEKLDRALKDSFDHVKHDTEVIYQWLQHFNNQVLKQEHLIEQNQHTIDDQDETIARLRHEIKILRQEIPRLSPETIKRVIDEHYHLGTFQDRLRTMDHRLEKLESRHHVVSVPEIKPRQQLKDKIIKKITRNSKEYVKNIILGMINKYGKISALQLREIVVEEQGLVSRSSFYRLLEELEEETDLQVISTGKEKVYMAPGTGRPKLRG